MGNYEEWKGRNCSRGRSGIMVHCEWHGGDDGREAMEWVWNCGYRDKFENLHSGSGKRKWEGEGKNRHRGRWNSKSGINGIAELESEMSGNQGKSGSGLSSIGIRKLN